MPIIEIDNYLKKIDNLTDNGNLEQAAFHCLYLLRQFPKMLRIYERLGRTFLEMDNYNGALNTYLRLCSAQPDNFLNHISLAYTYVECGRIENAIIHCETANCLQPDNQNIIKDLSNWMTAHSVSFSSDDRLLNEFASGIRSYQAKDYESACKHFFAAGKKPMPNLPVLFLGLSYFEKGETQKGVWLLETVLKREPYNLTALRTLSAYYAEHDRMKFHHCLDKLIDLDPQYQHWELQNGELISQHYPVNIAYYDWTGIPNTRVRIGWHQASEKLILNDNSRIPAWLDLIPIANNSSDSEESIQSLLNELELSNSGEMLYRKSFFTSKNIIQEPAAEEQTASVNTGTSASSELDEAFNYLEHIASRGFQPIDPKPEKENPDSNITASESKENELKAADENQAAQTPSTEDRQMMREAWRCFSTDQQELGVQLYRKLIAKPNCVSAVKEELEKLVILFPENSDLENIYNSIVSIQIDSGS